MAQVNAGFVTGARALIKIAGDTMAYATDVSYNITVQTIPIETMGKYEVHTNEPVAYNVDGSFSIVRYTGKSAEASNISDQENVNKGKAGNGPGSTSASGTAPGSHLNPGQLLSSSSFDIEIKEKGPGDSDDQDVFRINDCRITRRGASLNKRGVLVDSYSFVAILAGDTDNDSAFVSSSGMDKGADTPST